MRSLETTTVIEAERSIRRGSVGSSSSNLLLWGKCRSEPLPVRTAAFSLKLAFGGQERYVTKRGSFIADEFRAVLIECGESYATEVVRDSMIGTLPPERHGDGDSPVSAICLFFDESLAREAFDAHTLPDAALLEGGTSGARPAPAYRCLSMDDRLRALALRLWRHASDPEEAREPFCEALAWVASRASPKEADGTRLDVVRSSTRAELTHRMARARDLIESSYDKPLSLDRLAEVASMAPFHFHRRFTQLYGVTPHRLQVRRRVEQARWLVERTDLPLSEIVRRVGFQSVSSFSALFRRYWGQSAREVREGAGREHVDRP